MHRLFVSDLHLSDDTPDIEAAFTGLLKQESPFDSLVMLGDVFEAWVGDDDDSPLADRVRLALRALAESGTEILFTRGNRDFMLGEQFASDIGGTLLPDQTVLERRRTTHAVAPRRHPVHGRCGLPTVQAARSLTGLAG